MISEFYTQLCAYDNLFSAFTKARKGKTLKPYVQEFEINLEQNLLLLRAELLLHSYQPKPLETFILRDPKTRKISKSHFRDRVVHHALYRVIEPLVEKSFIYDSYANRIGKGALKAIERYEDFVRRVSCNFTTDVFVFKADIKKYFENVNHDLLLQILRKKITDEKVLWLIETILRNYTAGKEDVGMPLGNLTSQFFANVYLNELDQFVKHTLKVKYYIRYVDDFIIVHRSPKVLSFYKKEIDIFLQKRLALQLHPEKTMIISSHRGLEFLGMRLFAYHRLLKCKNVRKFYREREVLNTDYDKGLVNYDTIYDSLEGWLAYASHADTYKLKRTITKPFEEKFSHEISAKEVNRGRKKKR